MNVAQYKPSNTMRAAALESLSRFASIREAAQRAGQREQRQVEERFGSPAAVEINGAACVCDFAADGSARIVQCQTDACDFAVPEQVDGHPVSIIGPHAFCTCYQLERIQLPECVAEIGEYAFMNTALETFACPSGLAFIGKNAFYKCARLRYVRLDEKLQHIGESAFRETALEALDVPTKVAHIGRNAFKDTHLAFSGTRPTLCIASANPHYGLHEGALYLATDAGLELVQLLDAGATSYQGPAGLTFVGDQAFIRQDALCSVTLPDGVLSIGEAAFKGCTSLARIDLPDSVRRIGKRAFMDTALASLRIPRALEEAGTAAFYTGGSIARNFNRTIAHVDIAPGNDRFYLRDDMLCQHRDGHGDIVLLYIGDAESIVIPRTVDAIGPYAFLKAPNVRELHIHDRIEAIDVGGFDVGHAITTVVYDVYGDSGRSEPDRRYVIYYPPGQAGYQAVRQTFARGCFDLDFAYASADNAVLITQDTLIRSKAMLERMRDPVMLDEHMAVEYRRKLARTLRECVVAFGRGGFPQGIDLLYEQGLINAQTIDAAIEAASDAAEIAVLSRLMELKRTAFAAPMFDFDL